MPTVPLKERGRGRGIRGVQHDRASPTSRTCVMSRIGLEVRVGLEPLPLPHTPQCTPRDKEFTFRHLLERGH